MDELLPFGLTMIDLATIAAGIAALAALVAFWEAGLIRDPMRGRVKALRERAEALRGGLVQPTRRSEIVKSQSQVEWLRRLLRSLQVLGSEQTRKAQFKLTQAGIRNKDAVVVFLSFKLALPLAIALLAGTAMLAFDMFKDQPLYQLLFGPGAVVAVFLAPDIYLKNVTTRRVEAIRRSMPDALDLMVICAEAGLTMDAALQRVAREMAGASVELADELGLTAIELGFLPDRRQALQNLSDRVPLDDLRGVVTTLMQTEKYGTPLAMSLRVLSAEFRNTRMMRAEEKAAKLPTTMTVPLIIFILPTLFIVLMGPAACQVTDNFINRGQ